MTNAATGVAEEINFPSGPDRGNCPGQGQGGMSAEELLRKLNDCHQTSNDIPFVITTMESHASDSKFLIAGCNALSNLSCDMISSGKTLCDDYSALNKRTTAD